MRTGKKVITAYDRRQREYAHMMADTKSHNKRMQTGGYKKPGSRNPKKARNG